MLLSTPDLVPAVSGQSFCWSQAEDFSRFYVIIFTCCLKHFLKQAFGFGTVCWTNQRSLANNDERFLQALDI